MDRIWKALGAFALSLVMALTLASTGLCAAAQTSGSDAPSAGYLVILRQELPVYDGGDTGDQIGGAGLFAKASLMAADRERAELAPLAVNLNIYKANALSDIQNLVWSGQVELVEPDYEAELLDLDIDDPTQVNDDYFRSGYQYNLTGVKAQAAWDAGLTGEGVTVAIIDSGLNVNHIDAPIKVARGRYYFYREEPDGRYDFVINGVIRHYNYYSNDYIVDNTGHGSMVSGIVAANTNNASDSYTGGVAGIAPNATIMPVRCFTATANHLGGYVSNLISGINYAVENGADIISMSWGVGFESNSLKTTITAAANAGCILIASAGNDASSALLYPAAYPNVISVGSTNQAGGLSDFSQRTDTVNVCAPGGTRGAQSIYSLWYSSENAIGRGDGTSFAAPLVAGAAALLKERDPSMTQADFMALLRDNSDLDGIAEADRPYAGCGKLNVQKLISATGHAGAMLRYGGDGSVTIRAAHVPAAGNSELVMIGAYNAAGHLLDSSIAVSGPSSYGVCALTAAFRLPEAAVLKAYFLDRATLSPLGEPVTVTIDR